MPILLVKVNTNNVPESPGRWKAGQVVAAVDDGHTFGTAEVPAAGNFFHVTITDKTLEQVQEYLQGWSHEPTTVQISATGDNRRIEVTSTMVSAGGANAFQQAPVEALLADIGGTYVSHTNTSFQFDITATIEERDEIVDRINEAVRNMQYARRRWYINASGMTYLGNNGGVVSGTAVQIAAYLRDGLLD